LQCTKCNKIFEDFVSQVAIKFEKGTNLHSKCGINSLKTNYTELYDLITDTFKDELSKSSMKPVHIHCKSCNNTFERKLSYIISNNYSKKTNLRCPKCNDILIKLRDI